MLQHRCLERRRCRGRSRKPAVVDLRPTTQLTTNDYVDNGSMTVQFRWFTVRGRITQLETIVGYLDGMVTLVKVRRCTTLI